MQLGDVAHVVEDHPPLIGDALTTTGPGLMFVVEKAPGADTLEVTHGGGCDQGHAARTRRRDLRPDRVPAGDLIEQGIGNLETTLIVAAILALLALTAFLLRWRAGGDHPRHGAAVVRGGGARARSSAARA